MKLLINSITLPRVRLIKSFLMSAIFLCSTTSFAQVISDPIPSGGVDVISPVNPDKTISNTQRVKVLLSGYEYFPTRQDLDKIGNENLILDILESFADDQTIRPSLRLRATDAMGFYNTKRTELFLKEKIEGKINSKDTIVLQRAQKRIMAHAVTSYAKAFKKTGLAFLKTLAKKGNIDLKISAIYGIGKHCGKEGRLALSSLKKTEQNAAALRAIRKFQK